MQSSNTREVELASDVKATITTFANHEAYGMSHAYTLEKMWDLVRDVSKYLELIGVKDDSSDAIIFALGFHIAKRSKNYDEKFPTLDGEGPMIHIIMTHEDPFYTYIHLEAVVEKKSSTEGEDPGA